MSDEQDKPVEEKPEAEPQGPRGGERLAEARRAQQISVLEVAKELHLDEPKVRALERNEFDVLGAPVFAKGHLRKYAQLVGVDEADVFADYYEMTRSVDILPPLVPGRHRVRQELAPGPWIAAIVVILIAIASYWWFVIDAGTTAQPETSPAEQPVPEQLAPDQSADTLPVAEQPIVEATAAPDEARVVMASDPQPEPVQVSDGQTRLSLNFLGDCWTEVSDATGRRLFFNMGRTGRTVELTGTAPFAVLFGNVENVSVRVDGNDYAISPSNPGSRTARLTIMQP